MTSDTLISVVITCYNYARYVGAAIESALEQTYPHKEVVVVNDGSTDGSESVIGAFGDRVRLVNQPNQGWIAAYNSGFAAARGEVVIFLDADDLLEPGALSAVAETWTPTAAKVQYDLKIIDAAGRDLGRRFCYFSADYDAARVAREFSRTGTYRWPVTVGNAYSRWFLERFFPLQIEHGPDGFLNTVAPVYGEVRTIARPLAAYRLHGGNGWSSNGFDHTRLPARIRHRQGEVATMRQHAEARGIVVPSGDVLDHELAFLNYRMMALRLGLEYDGVEHDSPVRLLRCAYRTARHEKLPAHMTVAHVLWFGALSLAPPALAKGMIRVRFNRAELVSTARKTLQRLTLALPRGR